MVAVCRRRRMKSSYTPTGKEHDTCSIEAGYVRLLMYIGWYVNIPTVTHASVLQADNQRARFLSLTREKNRSCLPLTLW